MSNTPDEAVRTYLLSLQDPEALVDRAAIAEMEAAAATSTDPLERLRLLSRIERAKRVDLAHVEHEFVRQAKNWAEANEVSASAFQALGVPDAVLRTAGLLGGGRTPGRRAGTTTTAAPGRRAARSARNVTTAQVTDHVLGRSGPFTMAAVEADTGASTMTVRKSITALVEQGTVRRLGADPAHQGQGRAPIRYQTAD